MIQLLKGDCLELMKQIPNGSIDAIITDPPYGTTACKWDSVIDFDLMWEQMNRVIKPNGAIVLFGSEPFSSALRMSNIKNYKYDWIWDTKKTSSPFLAKKRPLLNYQIISVFNKKQPTYNPQPYKKSTIGIMGKKSVNYSDNFVTNKKNSCGKIDTTKNKNDNEFGYPRSIIKDIPVLNNLSSKDKSGLHPTQKPVALMKYLIKTYTNENETVLDFTMGSGSTGVACVNTNRNFIGIEMNAGYFDIATKRIQNNKPELKLF
jgi:DNA modification methylase